MTVNVTLSVSETSKPGYTPAKAESGGSLYYKYSGGSDGKGDVTEKVGHAEPIVVTLDEYGEQWGIWSVKLSHDPKDQFSSEFVPNWQPTQTIIDKDTEEEVDAHFSVVVMDKESRNKFDCDPRASNDPS